MTRCPDCGSLDMHYSQNHTMCKGCGLIVDDEPFETNPFIEDSRRSIDSIYSETEPVNGKIVKHHWLRSTREKNLYKARKSLEVVSSRLRLPDIVEKDSFRIFKDSVEKNLNVGWDNQSLLYASVYASCIIHGVPKTPDEIISYSGVSKARMLKAFRRVKEGLDMNIGVVDPADLVHRFASRLKLRPDTVSVTVDLIMQLKESNFVAGRQPRTIVATAMYLATKYTGDYRTQREIANATGVIEVTIRKRAKEIQDIN